MRASTATAATATATNHSAYTVSRHAGDFNRLARRVYEERLAAGEIRPPRKAKVSKATRAACALYRREKAKRVKRVDRLIAEAKAELARLDAMKAPRRGGRPRKGVAA